MPFCMFIVTSKTKFVFFKQQPVVCLHSDPSIECVTAPVSLTVSVFMETFHHLKDDSKSRQKHHF